MRNLNLDDRNQGIFSQNYTFFQFRKKGRGDIPSPLQLRVYPKLSHRTSCFDGFFRRYKILSSELSVTKNSSSLFSERILLLERNTGNPLRANFTKWSNTLKQFFGKLPTNCLGAFDHFVGLTLKGVNIAQYHRRELLEISPVSISISVDVLEINFCKALSLTGHEVKPCDF